MARMPLDRLRASTIRSKMVQHIRFRPLLNVDGRDPDCPWPVQDPYTRYGSEQFSADGPAIWFEPLPPMLTNLNHNPKLPPVPSPDTYTLVLDLDETLVHYFENDGMGDYGIRPGMYDFLRRMSSLGYELVIFTAATQDYADWVIDQIDPERLIAHRLYRQHALPWGPLFVKDLTRLGRNLDRTLIIDNVLENFMLQPHNGIFILTWYDDPNDTALFQLAPLLDELITTGAKVPDILEKYREQIPIWAGFDQYSQLAGEDSEFDPSAEDSLLGPSGGEYANEDLQAAGMPMPAAQQYQNAPALPASFQGSYQQAQAPPQQPPQRQMHVAGGLPADHLRPQNEAAHQQQVMQGASAYLPPRSQDAYPQAHQQQAQPQQMASAALPKQMAAAQVTRPAPQFSPASGPYQAGPPAAQQRPQAAQARAAPQFSAASGPYQVARQR